MIYRKDIYFFIVSIFFCLGLFIFGLVSGSMQISLKQVFSIFFGGIAENGTMTYIVQDRFLRTTNALISGGALAVVGMVLQSYFRNVLAGPGVLGISSGASFGVALSIFLPGLLLTGLIGQYLFGLVGAFSVIFLLISINKWIKGATLLIVGLMISFFTSAFVTILLNSSTDDQMRKYVEWGFGSFGFMLHDYFLGYIAILILSLGVVFFYFSKVLNIWVLGELFTQESGYKIKHIRLILLLTVGLIVALITVQCGPVAFLGIAVPQVVRLFLKTTNHSLLLPMSFFLGAILAMLADILVRTLDLALPLNGILALFGAPVIIYVIVRSSRKNIFV